MRETLWESSRVVVMMALVLTSMSGCSGQGYVGDRCGALNGTDDIRGLPTYRPVDPALSEPVTRVTGSPSTVGLQAFTPEFSCCSRQELDPGRSCPVDCAAWRTTVGGASLREPYWGELCNGPSGGSATCTAYFSRETGKLLGTFSFCYD